MKHNPTFFQPVPHNEISESQEDNWSFGERFNYSAKELMAKVYEVLKNEGVEITVKSANYMIKCELNRLKGNLTTANSQMEVELEGDRIVEENEDILPLQLTRNEESKKGKSKRAKKVDKYSKNKLVFGIQIFSIPNSDSHLLDMRFYKGHPLIFLDFSSRFISCLKSFQK